MGIGAGPRRFTIQFSRWTFAEGVEVRRCLDDTAGLKLVQDVHGGPLNRRQPRRRIRSGARATRKNQPARPAHYKESMDESLALPIIRMLLGLKGNVDEDNRPVEHKNAWRDEDGNWKADVDAIDVNGNTALHEAARRNAPRVVELLLGAFPSESVDLKI